MTTSTDGGKLGATSATMAMLQLLAGGWAARAIHAAATLGLADLLKDRSKTCAELAKASNTHPSSLRRLLRALAAVGLFTEEQGGQFSLTPLGATLRSDVASSLRAWAEYAQGDEAYRAWGSLLHSVRSGETAFNHAHGLSVWEHRSAHEEHASRYHKAMASLGGPLNDAAIASYPFSEIKAIVDVGGGDGSLLVALLTKHPAMSGALLDVSHVAEKGRQRLAEAGLSARCEVIAGDALIGVPGGADAYVLSRVIHDWPDAQAVAILKSCSRAMHGCTRLLIIERVLPTRVEASTNVAMQVVPDLNMMVMTGGRERTHEEFTSLLAAAGLRLRRIIPTRSPISVIEAGL